MIMNITMDPKNKKRRADRTFYDSDSDYETRTMTMNWPRFLLVESGDDSLPVTKLSPFAIDKGFQALISGRLRSIKRLRNGTFLVECDTKKQSDLLLKSQKLVDRPMTVSIHPTLNSSRGVIRCRELAGMSETDIRDELSEQGVILVKRIRRKEDGQDKDTNTLFLTFCNANLPKDIRIGYLRVKVDPFIPNPLRCFKCQKYGHGAQRCSSAAVCPKCALEHEGPCTNPPKCVNCKGAHPSSSKDCDVWKKEKQIQQVKTERKISYPDARRIVQETSSWSLPGAKPLFASVAAKQVVSCAVQTDITWVKSENPVRPKPPPSKETQAGTQTTPQQTPTKASQARPGRSSANKTAVEIVDGVASKKKPAPVRSASVSSRGKKSPVRAPPAPKEPDRQKKMEQDPIKLFNRFDHLLEGDLADIEMEADPVPSKS